VGLCLCKEVGNLYEELADPALSRGLSRVADMMKRRNH